MKNIFPTLLTLTIISATALATPLRPIPVDRPSKSDNPITLNKSNFMIETSFFDYTRNKSNSNESESFNALTSSTFKFGLTNNQELQILIDSYKYSRQNTNSELDEKDGLGDVTLRIKHNIFGNNGSKYALTIIPFLKIPTNQNELGNDHHEGGITIPLNINLAKNYSLTLQSGISSVKENSNRAAAYTNIATLSKSFTSKISAFTEIFFYKSDLTNSKWQNTLDLGISYAINENFVLDMAVNFGVSEYADDINILSGMAYRF